MKTKALLTFAAFAFACVACAQEPAPQFPRTFLDEAHDEWLETHCEARGVIDTNTADFNETMKGAHANFAELVAYSKGGLGAAAISVKAFACETRPGWYAADDLEKPSDL